MIDPSIISHEIENLETLAVHIEKDMKNLIDNSKVTTTYISEQTRRYYFENFSDDMWDLQRETKKNYEKWFSTSLIFIQQYTPEKQNAFMYFYSQDTGKYRGLIQLLHFESEGLYHSQDKEKNFTNAFKNDVLREFIEKFDEQRHILLTIPCILKIKELSIRGIVYTTFIDREIDEAVYLFGKSHYRAAGALAGVALEQHLRFLCDKNNLDYGNKDTIEPLVQKLYKNEKIDLTEMKQIQYLATIRDKCDHPSEITASEVKELIERIKRILNS